MSAAEELGGEGEADLAELGGADGLFLYTLTDIGDQLAVYPTEAEALEVGADIESTVRTLEVPAVADDFTQVWEFTKTAWADGELPYTETGNFWRWLRYNMNIKILPAGAVASGFLAHYLLKYAQEHGYPPAREPTFAPTPHYGRPPAQETGPGAVTTPAQPAPKPQPTHAQRAVAGATRAITPQSVAAPGLTRAEADAISKAIGAATADVLRVQAAVIDALLPGMAPGQVPEALSQLDQAATVLEHQVHALQRAASHPATTALPGQVSGLSGAVTGLQGAIALLTQQMAGEAGSGLLTDVDTLREAQAGDKLELAHIAKELPKLATTAALTALTAKVAVTVEELGLTHKSALDNALNGVEATIAQLRTETEDNADCCDAAHAVTDPISEGGATPSLLKSLGSLLKTAVEGVFIAGFLDTLLMIFDAPSVISTTVIDTETMSNWAISAAGVIEQDLSWLGKTAVSG